ncbi:MAG: hypothetical protein Q7T50_06990 [Candidatus Magasanikbacteria bacterium]|nr:hypothetical protein [Candidatus Magasanikbacteria bacterium]
MIFFVIKFLIWLILLSLALTALSLAPWVPTRRKDLERIGRIADLKEGQTFYDLGCGDGRVALYVSQNTPAKAVGIELAIPFYLYCIAKLKLNPNPKLSFKLKNLFKIDLRDADAVYLFAANSSKLSGEIIEKLETELKSGAKVISYAFPINSWTPVHTDKPEENDVSIYLYEIKK